MHPELDDSAAALDVADELARTYLGTLGDRPPGVKPPPWDAIALPEKGVGSAVALRDAWSLYGAAFSGNPGPRYWAFVAGGVTPAALAADWLTSAIDQNVHDAQDGAAVNLERHALDLLRQMFALPPEFTGLFVSGGTMANFVGIALGAQVLGRRRGVDVSRDGISALRGLRILSGEAHASIAKVAAMAGIGRNQVELLPCLDGREAVDVTALGARLDALAADPVIIVANAGTVTTGDFDDLDAIGRIAQSAGAYLHVDGAFGLFARISDSHRHLTAGLEYADSIASDAHKFLNVPQDTGFVFTRHLSDQIDIFKSVSHYLPAPAVSAAAIQHMGPENSRRLRGLPVWASLHAYGRAGYAAIVERCAAHARDMGARIAALDGFRLMAPVRYNVVCFELIDEDGIVDEAAVAPFVDRIRHDGRLFIGVSRFLGRACVRFAIVNWRTSTVDLDIAAAAMRDCRWEPVDPNQPRRSEAAI